ncbi:MAG: GumC family protein [Opitutales bacterium]
MKSNPYGGREPEGGGYYYGYGYNQGSYGGGYGGYDAQPHRSLKDYLLIFRERIWYFILTFFIIFAGALIYTFNKTPVYTAAAMVQVLRDDPNVMPTADVEMNEIRSAEDLNTQINLLESGAIIEAVEKRLVGEDRRLFMEPYEDTIRLSGPLSPTEILARNRAIIPRRLSLNVQVAYSHPYPEIAAKVANLFADEFINYNLNRNIDASMKAVEDLNARAEQQRAKVEELELRLSEYKERHNAISLDKEEDIASQELSRLNDIVVQSRNTFDNAKTRWDLIQSYRDEGRDLWELGFIAQKPRVSELLSRVSSLKIQIASLSERYRAKHPTMIEAQRSLNQAEAELASTIRSSVEEVKADYNQAEANFNQALATLRQKESELIELGKTRVEYNSILTDLQVQRSFYQAINNRLAEQVTQVNLVQASARIIDRAQPPVNPSSPRVKLNLALGFVGGIACGIGMVFLVAFVDDRVKTAFDIEGVVGLPLVGIVPRLRRMDASEKAKVVASNADRHTTEAFRSIHSTLKLNDDSKNAKVILTTSTVPGEGKSFISTNLALTYANHGEKTLLFDGDLRLPNIGKSLQITKPGGLVKCLEENGNIQDHITRDFFPNLDVLPAGAKAKNPTQILNSSKFEALLDELRNQYDRIIIDSPPLAAVSDGLTFLPLVDGVVYVIKFNTVKRKTAKVNVRRLWESSTPVFGAVLNNISASISSYYYSHYYDRGYKDYYVAREDEEAQEQETVTVPTETTKR